MVATPRRVLLLVMMPKRRSIHFRRFRTTRATIKLLKEKWGVHDLLAEQAAANNLPAKFFNINLTKE